MYSFRGYQIKHEIIPNRYQISHEFNRIQAADLGSEVEHLTAVAEAAHVDDSRSQKTEFVKFKIRRVGFSIQIGTSQH